jgi:hypothetical protein
MFGHYTSSRRTRVQILVTFATAALPLPLLIDLPVFFFLPQQMMEKFFSGLTQAGAWACFSVLTQAGAWA